MTSLRSRTEFALLWGAAFLFRWLPLPLSRGLAALVGWLAGSLIRLRRQVALENVRQAFPDLSEAAARRTVARVWRHFARVGAELARLPRMTLPAFELAVDGREIEVIRRSIDRGKGAIFVSGHLGNWEWLGAMAARAGIPVSYVVTTQSNKLVEAWMDRMRLSSGVEIIPRRNAVRGVLSALRRNRAVAILCDQDAGLGGVFVSFFGTAASTPRGPAIFHIKTGAPLIFGCCCRIGKRYVTHFEELPSPYPVGDRETDERAVMDVVTRRLEEEIRRYPDQYLWLHRRWKSRAS